MERRQYVIKAWLNENDMAPVRFSFWHHAGEWEAYNIVSVLFPTCRTYSVDMVRRPDDMPAYFGNEGT